MESCFPDCKNVSFTVPLLKTAGQKSLFKNYIPISPCSVIIKICGNFVVVLFITSRGKVIL